jgi:sulfur-oxidizing protein SoxY
MLDLPPTPPSPGNIRRRFLAGGLRAVAVGIAAWGAGGLPRLAAAAATAPASPTAPAPPAPALFVPRTLSDTLNHALGGSPPKPSPGITLELPDVAEDGAAVPVRIAFTLKGVRSVLLFAEKNRVPLLAEFPWHRRLSPPLSLRIKLAETSRVLVVVRTDTGDFMAERSVKVIQGGCG